MQPLTLLLLAATASAQSLASVLTNPAVSELAAVLSAYPAIVKTLSGAKDITILAPANGARGLRQLAGAAKYEKYAPGLTEATLTYHVLKGAIPASAVPANAFVETLLTNGNYSAVTGGQRVQATKKDGKVVFISGGGAKSTVTAADIKFDGGVIHLIDAVLQPPQAPSIVARAGGLTTLASTLASQGLAKTVDGLKGITIFAPTNAAFDAASGLIETLSKEQLAGALTYHVVKAVAYSTDVKDGLEVPTVQGKTLKITVKGGSVYVNKAKVIKTDILTKNGVVHVIDGVLTP
ncbi:beta-Ig-H3/fasciclin [Trichodelitschia bisporula]|uniref:Beta-Ig-H3/fasciclin n=1 Tax=Trichodelitschia bisporula TaxID=703511 RepID=A0A6G1HKS7_9PEZI|nr:beta-Ig-H3/fasciclin [Trichodelitschia bisporula]